MTVKTHRVAINLNAPFLRAISNQTPVSWLKENIFELALAEERSVAGFVTAKDDSKTDHQETVLQNIQNLERALNSLEAKLDAAPGSTAVIVSFDFAFKNGVYDGSNEFSRIELNDNLLCQLYVCAHMRMFGHTGVTDKEVAESDMPILEEIDIGLRLLDWSSAEVKAYLKVQSHPLG